MAVAFAFCSVFTAQSPLSTSDSIKLGTVRERVSEREREREREREAPMGGRSADQPMARRGGGGEQIKEEEGRKKEGRKKEGRKKEGRKKGKNKKG